MRRAPSREGREKSAKEERAAPYDKDEYAKESRHSVTPDECLGEGQCWVIFGGAQHLNNGPMGSGGTPRCVGCGGKLLLDRWRTPEGLGLPKYGGRVGRSRGPKEP